MYNNYLGGQGQGQGQQQQQQQSNNNGGGNTNANLFAALAQQLGGVALQQQQQQQQAQSQPQQQQYQQQQQQQPNSNANVAALALLQQQLALFQQIQSATQALAAGQGLQLPQGLQGLQGQGQNQQQQALNLLLAAAQQQQQQQPQSYQQQQQQQQQYPPASSSSSNTSPAAQVAALAQWTSAGPPAPSALSSGSSTSAQPKKPHTATWNPTASNKSTAAAPAYGAMAYPARDTLSQRQKRELAARQQEAQFRMASSGAAAAGEERDREYRHGGGPQRHHQHETGGGGGNRDRDRFNRSGGEQQARHQPASPVAPWKQNQHQQPARNFSPPPVGRAASPVRQAPPANTSAPASGSGWASLMTFNSAPPAPPAQAASQPPPQLVQQALPATNKFGLPPAPSQRHQQQKQQQQQQHHQQQPAQKPSSALFAMFGGGGGADNRTSTMPNHMPAGTGQSPYPNQATHDDQRAVRGYKDLYGPNAGVGGGRAKPTFQCEPCDKTFPSASQLRSHLDTHVNCSQPQCTYQASQRAVKFHEMEAHGMHQEDGDQGEILLPAHIKLDTPEQIAQWIADRKKRYPTDANIAAKAADQQARLARGELPLASTSSALAAPLCRFIRNNQTCPHGANCKFRHALAPGELEADNAPGMYAGRGKRAPLLERLLEREMRLEHSHLLQCLRFMVNNRFFEFGVVWKSGLEDGPGARTWGAKPGEVHAEAEAEAEAEAAAEGEVKGEKVVDEVDEMVFGQASAESGLATPGAGANVPDLETLRKQLLEAEHEDAMFYSDEEDHGMDVDDGQDNEGMADASSLDLIASLGGIRRRQSDGADDDVYADEGDDEYDRTPMVFVDNDDEQGDADQAEQSSSSDQEASFEEEEA